MKYILAALAAAAGALILIQPQVVSSAVSDAVRSCIEIIVPSLFAFTVLAVYLQASGLYRIVLRPITLPLSKLMRMNEELCAVIILSNIGGYPVGAKLLSALVRQGRLSKEDAGRMLCCCFGSGPSFVIGIAGVTVFGSAATGAVIFAACFVSSIIIAAMVRLRGEIILKGKASGPYLTADCFISSVMTAAEVMLTVCVMIVGFAVISALLKLVGVNAAAEKLFGLMGAEACSQSIFPAILEVSCIKALKPVGAWVVPLCAALLSFGGICVQMQVGAIAKGIPLKHFLLSRPAAAILSAAISLPALLLPQPAAAAMAVSTETKPFSASALISGCVLIMCGILLAGRQERN